MMKTCFLLMLLLLMLLTKAKRIYQHQFPVGSEQLIMPRTVLFSSYMGKISYPHMPLLFESMRWNPMVDFKVINIIPTGSNYADEVLSLAKNMSIPNLHIVVITMDQWKQRVKDRLDLDINWNLTWSYKMCDYKPVMAYLFPEYTGPEYKYWGFGDMDLIWGNFTRFAGWFQGQSFIISGWWRSTGAGQFFINEEWTRTFMFSDVKYKPLLKNLTYHNLDEAGAQIREEFIVDDGEHAISGKIDTWAFKNQKPLNKGKDWKDHCFLDEGDAIDWAGPIRWFRGSLQIVHGSPEFPPGRELLFFHRPTKLFDYPDNIKQEVIEDMMKYGYLLPHWIPLMSRFMCPETGKQINSTLQVLTTYMPYKDHCITKN